VTSQPQPEKASHPLVDAVQRASTTALAMAVLAVAVIGVDAAVAVHRSSGSSSHSAAASPPPSGVPSPGGPQTNPTLPGTTPPSATGSASPESASQRSLQTLLAKTYAAALLKGSVHSYARDVTKGGGTAIFNDDDATTSGEQHITIHGGHIQIRVVGSTTYFTGDTRGMEKYFNFTKQEVEALHRQWLSLVSGQAGYTEVTAGVTLASTLDEVKVGGQLSREPEKTLDGQQVFGISGQASGQGAPKKAHATMWISSASGLPVEFDATNATTRLTQKFTDWGRPIHVETPAKVFGSRGLSS
jgi:hypothetical protein